MRRNRFSILMQTHEPKLHKACQAKLNGEINQAIRELSIAEYNEQSHQPTLKKKEKQKVFFTDETLANDVFKDAVASKSALAVEEESARYNQIELFSLNARKLRKLNKSIHEEQTFSIRPDTSQ